MTFIVFEDLIQQFYLISYGKANFKEYLFLQFNQIDIYDNQ